MYYPRLLLVRMSCIYIYYSWAVLERHFEFACRQEEDKDALFEQMRRDQETTLEAMKEKMVATIGSDKLKREAEK